MAGRERSARADRAEGRAFEAADWLAARVPGQDPDPSLYHGLAGAVLGLDEAARHAGTNRYDAAIEGGTSALGAAVEDMDDCSLHFGLAGVAGALRALGCDAPADRALGRIRDRFDGHRWNEMFELLVGNAGIGLGALWAGDVDLAVAALEPYLGAADPTPAGVNWAVRPSEPRSHHMAHGTLGIALALATVGDDAGRRDMVDLAVAGAADVVGRDEAGPDGFLVPHSDPPHRPDVVERYSYGWCNGPAGDAQAFRLLGRVTSDPAWDRLADRCWRTVTGSGLPRRSRPGFWDNNGRCCGTAGVLALACDRIVERGDGFAFADVLVDDLLARATVDGSGARWSNHEHRVDPPDLEPVTGWAMGNAGIIRELLRYVRLCRGSGEPGYAHPWPDQPVPAAGAVGAEGLEPPTDAL